MAAFTRSRRGGVAMKLGIATCARKGSESCIFRTVFYYAVLRSSYRKCRRLSRRFTLTPCPSPARREGRANSKTEQCTSGRLSASSHETHPGYRRHRIPGETSRPTTEGNGTWRPFADLLSWCFALGQRGGNRGGTRRHHFTA